jgi:hypothetical protein
MLTEDYIMRMISQALAVIMAALGLKRAGKLEESLQTFDQAIGTLLGLDAHLVSALDDKVILKMLSFLDNLDIDRLLVLADIFREEADLYSMKGQAEKSQLAAQRSLRFYLEVSLISEANPDLELIQKIEGLRHKLSTRDLDLETRLALSDYLERLLAADDDFLSAAGLSRAELQVANSSINIVDI